MTLYVFGSSRVEGEPSRSIVEVYITSMAVDQCLALLSPAHFVKHLPCLHSYAIGNLCGLGMTTDRVRVR
jgi:hypothetical protein